MAEKHLAGGIKWVVDIRDKGDRIAIKFRWRDPNLQIIF